MEFTFVSVHRAVYTDICICMTYTPNIALGVLVSLVPVLEIPCSAMKLTVLSRDFTPWIQENAGSCSNVGTDTPTSILSVHCVILSSYVTLRVFTVVVFLHSVTRPYPNLGFQYNASHRPVYAKMERWQSYCKKKQGEQVCPSAAVCTLKWQNTVTSQASFASVYSWQLRQSVRETRTFGRHAWTTSKFGSDSFNGP